MPIHPSFDIVQELVLFIQLVAHLYSQHALPAYTLSKRIELLILISQYLLVICVYLLIVQIRLVWRLWLISVPLLV